MPILIVGALLMLMGLAAGGALLLAPLGMLAIQPGAALWLLFPLFLVGGFTICASAGGRQAIRGVTLAASWLLLAMAVAAAGGLLAAGLGLLPAREGTASLWYVLAVAGMLGSLGAAAFGRAPERVKM
jgi:hypothetical protein